MKARVEFDTYRVIIEFEPFMGKEYSQVSKRI